MNRTVSFVPRLILFLLFLLPLTAHAQHEIRTGSSSLQQGIDLFEKGLYPEAAAYFEKILLNQPEDIQETELAAYFHARSAIKVDSTLTDRQTDRFANEFPHSRYTAVLLKEAADQHKERGELDRAIQRMQQALNYPQSSSRKAELYYNIAETAAENGQNDLAREMFLELSDNHRRSEWSPKALYARGRLYLEDEDYERSADAFELLRERHPFDQMTRRIGTALGESYYQQRRFAEAIEALERALPLLDDENRSKAVYLIAESYNAQNDFENATRFYRMYINRAEDEDQARIAHYGLGWVYHKQEIYHWAADSFGRAAVGSDEVARKGLYYQAVNNKLAGRYQNALDAFRQFGNRFDDGVFFEEAYFEWAVTAFEIGFNGEAIDALLPLARIVDELENPGEVLTFLGEVYFANSEYTRALETFEMASQLTDLDEALIRQARFQMAWVRYSNQAYRQAQPEFEAVYNEWPNSDLGREALFWSADAHFQYENFGPASSQYARFINDNPSHSLIGAAKYALGWAYFKMGDYENATGPLIDFLDNYDPPSIALFPYDTDTQLRIGDAFYAQGKYQEALEYYNRTIGADPGGDYAMFQVANSYYRMNRNFDAVTQFRRMLRIYPYSRLREQAQYNVAYIYLNTGNYDQAVEEFNTVIERFPGTEWAARAQYNIGDSYYNAGDYERAIEEYRRVLEGYPGSTYVLEAVNGIQFAQLSAGRDDQSTDILEEFLDENPTSSTADRLRFRQAENTLQSGDYQAAVSEFRQYLRITNNESMMPEAYFNLADAYLRMDRPNDAAEAYRTIAEDFPNSDRAAPALAELGQILLNQGSYDQSESIFRELAEKDSRFQLEAYLGLGRANLGKGDTGAARQHFERVLSINENNDAARTGLGKVLLEDGRNEEARRFFSLVAENNSTEIGAESQYLLGISHMEAGNREQALEEFSRVRVLFGAYDIWVSEAQYKTAEIYIREGRRGDALSLLNSIVDTYPGTSGAEKAQQLLDRN
ncbi:tetratricopeptide repeat protein [Rhodohalobacter sp. SW132]|uniref:tetratricopeptide repeat protein n=1 Tax=Rhodohalobacter sp. SW132 TaxID=2293433 RepID=UPI000E22AE13|nr:tetratricopeptide repeat protein [Rhodohalobacter sp. SW132]REL24852.1 tetratricopeptide repeat protein [Rhodohalobacter sp. SW132]